MSDADRARWNARYTDRGAPDAPSTVLLSIADELPRSGGALDVAGGGGRHAVWLAKRGLDATVVDFSAAGLAIARERAEAAGVSIETVEADLETEPLPPGPWDLIVSFHYLNRLLFDQFAAELAPGGLLVLEQATVRNLERHEKPQRRFCLDEGELATLVTGLEVLRCDEGWREHNHHDAVLIARKR